METAHKKEMEILIIIEVLLKLSLGWLGLMTLFQRVLDKDIFEQLVEFLPSQVLMVLGFLYLVFIVARKGHDTYTKIQINRLKIREQKEKHKQSQIYTKIKNKELDEK